jgi:carbamoyl-phosphate synthase large subunit
VIAGDADPDALSGHVADGFWHMPHLDAVPEDVLIEGCLSRGIRSVLPTRDGELTFWAEVRDHFAAAGIGVIVSPLNSVARCLDKLAFSEGGARDGLPVILTARSPDECNAERFVVKERFGAGSKSLGLDLERDAALIHARGLVDPIFQPFVPGPEISIDAWLAADHTLHGLVLRRRDKVVRGESQITTTFRNAALEREAQIVLSTLRLRGPVVMQAIVPPTGGLRVIECNARFGGASTASIGVGLDMLFWSLLEYYRPGSPLPPFVRHPGEVRQVRVPQDVMIYGADL